MGEYVTEQIENLVWPCRLSKELCKSKQFFESNGYPLDFKQSKQTQYNQFLSDIHVNDDTNCVLLAFWQNRIVSICLDNDKLLSELNAVITLNFETIMTNKKFFLLELNKKPNDIYEFPVKYFAQSKLMQETIKPLQQGISKSSGEVIFEYDKVQDNCSFN